VLGNGKEQKKSIYLNFHLILNKQQHNNIKTTLKLSTIFLKYQCFFNKMSSGSESRAVIETSSDLSDSGDTNFLRNVHAFIEDTANSSQF